MIFSREYHDRFSQARSYPWILGLSACILMITGLVPFEVVLIPAVASSPKKWKVICAAAVIGSSLGAAILSFLFETAGWPILDHLFPSLSASHEWLTVQNWMSLHGAWALVAIAALPIAQAPALAVAGLFKIPAFAVLAAFLAGKSVKYAAISALVARGEERFVLRKSAQSR